MMVAGVPEQIRRLVAPYFQRVLHRREVGFQQIDVDLGAVKHEKSVSQGRICWTMRVGHSYYGFVPRSGDPRQRQRLAGSGCQKRMTLAVGCS